MQSMARRLGTKAGSSSISSPLSLSMWLIGKNVSHHRLTSSIFLHHSVTFLLMLNRTIMALWKARSLSPEQKVKIVEESEAKSLQSEESGSFLGLDDVTLSEVYSAVLSVPVSSLSLSLVMFRKLSDSWFCLFHFEHFLD